MGIVSFQVWKNTLVHTMILSSTVSDKNPRMLLAVKEIFSEAYHNYCLVHLSKNLVNICDWGAITRAPTKLHANTNEKVMSKVIVGF